jgi:hypothetical protein
VTPHLNLGLVMSLAQRAFFFFKRGFKFFFQEKLPYLDLANTRINSVLGPKKSPLLLDTRFQTGPQHLWKKHNSNNKRKANAGGEKK